MADICEAGDSPVWNLAVAGQPEYLANGILVHNCIQAFWLNSVPHSANARRYAVSAELDAQTADPRRRRMTPHQAEQEAERQRAWDLDSFAPQDERPQRANVRSWR